MRETAVPAALEARGVAITESLRFLLRAGEALAASLDYRATLSTLAELAVPAIADWCAVDLLDDAGTLQRLAVAHRDPAKIQLVREIEARYPQDRSAPTGPYERIRTQQVACVPDITEDMLAGAARDSTHLEMIRALGLRSYISVPLLIRSDCVGLFTIVTAESGRAYSPADLELAVELARRASTAIDHARTYERAVATAEQLERQTSALAAQAEELRNAEQFARGIVESIVDPMVIYDEQWRVRYENAAALRVFATTGGARSMLGRSLWEEYPDLRGTAFEREMRRAMEERVPTSFVEVRRGSGHWTDVRCYPLPDGGIAAVWRDITQQKRAEQALQYLAAASEVLGSSLDYEATTNALVALLVPELADWCSVSLLDGDRIRMVAVAHRDPVRGAMVRALESKYPSSPEGHTQTARVIRTGRSEIVPEITEAMLDAAIEEPEYRDMVKQLGFGSVMTVPLTVRDRVLGAMSLVGITTESGRRYGEADLSLAEELGRRAAIAIDNALLFQEALEARRNAETANSAKTDFLTRMSHELRTPLNAIGGYTELLAMGVRGPVTDEQVHDLRRIARSQHHLLNLINDVLNYAKLEAGQLQYNVRPIPLIDCLETLEPMFGPQVRDRQLTYRLEVSDRELHVLADTDRLHQILLNLVGNAVKFTDPGGSVVVSAQGRDGVAEVRVTDTGRGIPTDKLESVFEPFVQLKRAGEVLQGTGLGLSISRDLARAMQGDLRAESNGRGATFVLTMPKVESG